MKIAKKLFSLTTASLILLQSVSPVSFITYAAESIAANRITMDVRLTTVTLRTEYNKMVAENQAQPIDALLFALQMYAVQTAGPSCVRQFESATAVSKLGQPDAGSFKTSATQASPVVENVAPICFEIFGSQEGDPSAELLRLYSKLFASFFPNVNFDTFVAGVMGNEDPSAYMIQILGSDVESKLAAYINTGQLPNNPVCTLSPAAEAQYLAAKQVYTQAIDAKNAAAAQEAFAQMEAIQAAANCSTATQEQNISNPACAQRINTLDAQLRLLSTSENQADVARIQAAKEAIQQSPTCTLTTRSSVPFVTRVGESPRLESSILNFQTTSTIIPDTTAQYCTQTASTLSQQLNTASYLTINRLLNTIGDVKPVLSPEKQIIASFVEVEAARVAAEKAQQLGLTNPAAAMDRFLRVLEMIANSFLSNQAAYKVLDIFPLLGEYSDALEYTKLGGTDSFDAIQNILDAGLRLVWNDGAKVFLEESTSQPGLVVFAKANEQSNNNDLIINLRNLSAYQFKDRNLQHPMSRSTIAGQPTLADLESLYYGDGNTPYASEQHNRVWYAVDARSLANLDDEMYASLMRNRQYYPVGVNQSLAGIEMYDINGLHIAIIPNHDTRKLSYVPAGLYEDQWTRIEVGQNGLTNIFRKSESTYPRSIDISATINNILTAAAKIDIKRPEELAPIIREEVNFVKDQFLVQGSNQNYFSESGVGVIRAETNTAVSTRTVSREFMLPERISGTIFLDPLAINFEATRSFNEQAGTNTVSFTATMRGGTTCGIQFNGSVTYYGNEFGEMQYQPNDNKNGEGSSSRADAFVAASFDMGANGYTFHMSTQQMAALIQAFMNDDEGLLDTVNSLVTNQFKVLNQSIGSLEATQDGIDIVYSNNQRANFVELLLSMLDNIDLGWASFIVDMFDDGGDKDPRDAEPQQSMWIYVQDAYQDGDIFSISFVDEYGVYITPASGPTLSVTTCPQECESTSFMMMPTGDGYTYSYTLDPELAAQAVSITVEAYNQNRERARYTFK